MAEVVEERLEAQVLTDLVALLPVMLVHTLDGALDACCQGQRGGEGTRLLRGSPAGVTDPANRRSAASRTRWPTFSVINPSSSSSITGDPVHVGRESAYAAPPARARGRTLASTSVRLFIGDAFGWCSTTRPLACVLRTSRAERKQYSSMQLTSHTGPVVQALL